MPEPEKRRSGEACLANPDPTGSPSARRLSGDRPVAVARHRKVLTPARFGFPKTIGAGKGHVMKALVSRISAMALALLVSTGAALAQAGSPRDPGSRIALLIGNAVRPDGAAGHAVSLQAVADQLRQLGFAATAIDGADRTRMLDAIRDFTGKVSKGSTALLLYRGAMLRLGPKNFMMPADARGSSEADARRAGIEIDGIEADLSRRQADIKIMIVDATRSGIVADRFGLTHRGPAALDLHDGTLAIVNAGQDPRGDKAAPPGEDDVFLTELLKQTAIPGITVEQAFASTRAAVATATAGRQVPSISSTLLTDFYFVPDGSEAGKSGQASTMRQVRSKVAAPEASPPATGEAPKPGETFKDCDICPEVVVVPPGEFAMGSTESDVEKPPHRVVIERPFAIGRHEVTFAQWDACVAANACRPDIDDHGFGRGQRPVIDVNWDEAQGFLKWLSARTRQRYRLPSEAEWEYAARAGSRSAFPWGATGTAKANCDDCGPDPARATVPVGSYRPNAFGLYDTSGNAAEWVEDCWNAGYKGAPADGSPWRTGQCQLRVLRGGAFANKAGATRSPARFRYDHDVRYYTNGFRIARDLQ